MTKFNSLNAKSITSGTWVIHSEQTLAAPATSVTISNLNGDVDGEYRLIVRHVGGATNARNNLRFNLATSGYGDQRVYGGNTTPSADRKPNAGASIYCSGIEMSGNISMSDTLIKCGNSLPTNCLIRGMNNVSGTTVTYVLSTGGVYNSTENITSIVVASNTNGLGIGTYILLLKKVESTTTSNAYNSVQVPIGKLTADTLCTIAEGTLAENATDITLTGLDGQTDVIYELELNYIAPGDDDITLQMQADTTAGNYGYQYLQGSSTTISAARKTNSQLIIAGADADNRRSMCKALIYAKDGFIRTGIVESAYEITGTTVTTHRLSGIVWNDTTTDVSQMVLKGDFKAGSFYRLKTLRRKV